MLAYIPYMDPMSTIYIAYHILILFCGKNSQAILQQGLESWALQGRRSGELSRGFIGIASGKLPSGEHTKSYWKWPFIVDFPLKMVIFHSYVKLPEGKTLPWNIILMILMATSTVDDWVDNKTWSMMVIL